MTQAMEIIGLIAGACTTFSSLPQIKKIFDTRSTRDLSYLMYFMNFTGCSLWVTYGFLKESISLIVANAISVLLLGSVILLKYRWDKNPSYNKTKSNHLV